MRLNLRLSRRPFHQSVIRRAGEAKCWTGSPIPSPTFNNQGSWESQAPRGQGPFRRPSAASAALPSGRQNPAPPLRFESARRHLPAPARPNNRTASFAGKARSGSQAPPPAQRSLAVGRGPRASEAENRPRTRGRCLPWPWRLQAPPGRRMREWWGTPGGRSESVRWGVGPQWPRQGAGAGGLLRPFFVLPHPPQRPRKTPWFPLASLLHSPIAAGARLHTR